MASCIDAKADVKKSLLDIGFTVDENMLRIYQRLSRISPFDSDHHY
jgi:hypothetical protein